MRKGFVRAITVGTVVAGLASAVPAHVSPSVDDNNRYMKLTPMSDRVRLAYTVLFGDVPGAQQRRAIDANRDGTITDDESHAFGDKLAAEVLAGLEAAVDGTTQKLVWSQVVVGMNTPSVTAGTFSIDLVAYLCLPSARGRHQVRLFDRFRISRPGETELKVEDSPGVTIEHARIGQASDPTFTYRFVGAGGPLADDGVDLAFVASDKAPLGGDGGCHAVAPGRRSVPTALVVGSAAVLGFLLALAVVLVKRRKHRRAA